jgi:hypothetical protein
MKPYILLLLLALTMPTLAQSAKKTGPRATGAEASTSVKGQLSAHAWRMQNVTLADGRTMGEIEPGKLHMHGIDNGTEIDTTLISDEVFLALTFNRNGTFQLDVRLPGFTDQEKGRWKISSDQKRIILTEKNRQSREYSIDELDGSHVLLNESHVDMKEENDSNSIVRYELVARD